MEKLGINLGLLISQAINFGLLVALLYLLLYKPVLKMLDERDGAALAQWLDAAAQRREALVRQKLRELNPD